MGAGTVRHSRKIRAAMRMKNEISQLPHGCGHSAVFPQDPRRHAHEIFRKKGIVTEKKTGNIPEKRNNL